MLIFLQLLFLQFLQPLSLLLILHISLRKSELDEFGVCLASSPQLTGYISFHNNCTIIGFLALLKIIRASFFNRTFSRWVAMFEHTNSVASSKIGVDWIKMLLLKSSQGSGVQLFQERIFFLFFYEGTAQSKEYIIAYNT